MSEQLDDVIKEITAVRNSIFYWMTRHAHTDKGAFDELAKVKEQLTDIIKGA